VKTLPKNMIARYPMQDLYRAGFQRPALARIVHATRSDGDVNSKK
jgi:hypothetical protein